jgi:outer membrane protein assembly factor BamB
MAATLMAIALLHIWTHVDRGWFLAVPTIGHSMVYEGTTLGDVLALDERDGSVRWRASLGANPDATYGSPCGVISSIAVSGGVAYAASGSCMAAAFNAFYGRLLWKRRICSIAKNDDTYAAPIVADGRVLLGIDVIADRPTDVGREVALDATTGKPVWSFTPVRYRGTGGGVSATPAFDTSRDVAIIGTGNPTPMLDERDGRILWQRALEPAMLWTQAIGTPAVAAFDLRTGRLLAQLPVPSELFGHGLALDGDRLFVAGRGALWAYRLQE